MVKWHRLFVALSFVFVQELVFDAVCKLQGSVVGNAELSRLLTQTQSNIDSYHSVLHELHTVQVYVSLSPPEASWQK